MIKKSPQNKKTLPKYSKHFIDTKKMYINGNIITKDLSPIINPKSRPVCKNFKITNNESNFRFDLRNNISRNSTIHSDFKMLKSISNNNDSSIRIISTGGDFINFNNSQVCVVTKNGSHNNSRNNSFIKEIESIHVKNNLEKINECDETQNSICFSKCQKVTKSYEQIADEDSIIRDDSFVRTLYDTMDISAVSCNSLNSTTIFNEIVMENKDITNNYKYKLDDITSFNTVLNGSSSILEIKKYENSKQKAMFQENNVDNFLKYTKYHHYEYKISSRNIFSMDMAWGEYMTGKYYPFIEKYQKRKYALLKIITFKLKSKRCNVECISTDFITINNNITEIEDLCDEINNTLNYSSGFLEIIGKVISDSTILKHFDDDMDMLENYEESKNIKLNKFNNILKRTNNGVTYKLNYMIKYADLILKFCSNIHPMTIEVWNYPKFIEFKLDRFQVIITCDQDEFVIHSTLFCKSFINLNNEISTYMENVSKKIIQEKDFADILMEMHKNPEKLIEMVTQLSMRMLFNNNLCVCLCRLSSMFCMTADNDRFKVSFMNRDLSKLFYMSFYVNYDEVKYKINKIIRGITNSEIDKAFKNAGVDNQLYDYMRVIEELLNI